MENTTKPQPWFHSWWGDFLGLHSLPFVFILLAFFGLPPFAEASRPTLFWFITWILVIDWGHIFAQWYRIYSNPLETKKLKIIYPLAFLLIIPFITVVVHYSGRFPVETFFIYFVIYHFIKQHYGYTRIYSGYDGSKTKFENRNENILIYSSMVAPVIYWHHTFPYEKFLWYEHFIKFQYVGFLSTLAFMVYGVSLLFYIYFEVKRYREKKLFNISKNVAILAAALGWGMISVLSETKLLIFFIVILTHDISYVFFVWLIGRRDRKILHNKISYFSWWSVPGFFCYVLAIVVIGQLILGTHHRLVGSMRPNVVLGDVFSFIPYAPGWWSDFGVAIFFSTQAHHYFIDRFLWKKEKDLKYMTRKERHPHD